MNYPLLKLLHVAGVIIFLGNIIAGHFWIHLAMKSKDFNIIKHSIRGVMRSDKVFTIPAVIVIIVAGILAAVIWAYPHSTHRLDFMVHSFILLFRSHLLHKTFRRVA